MVPVTAIAEWSPAAKQLEAVWVTWSGFTREAFEQLGAMTGNRRAAAELERTLHSRAGLQRLIELLRNLGSGRSAPDYGRSGSFLDATRTI